MIDDVQLDMLVDGELSEDERRELLSRLDAEDDGWRRCALAFLQAQSWRDEMRSISAETNAGISAEIPRSRRLRRWLQPILAVAATFLLAFGLGLGWDNLIGRAKPRAAPNQVAGQAARVSSPEEAIDVEQPEAPKPNAAPESAVPYQYVSLPAEDPVSGEAESVRMPVIPQEYLGEGWPYRLPAVVPDQVVQALRQRGHDVVQQRRLVPLQAADGSRIVFPVDEVEFVPVSNRGYQ